MINPKLSMEDIQAAEDALGLNDPIYVQYFKWLGQILQGNNHRQSRNASRNKCRKSDRTAD